MLEMIVWIRDESAVLEWYGVYHLNRTLDYDG